MDGAPTEVASAWPSPRARGAGRAGPEGLRCEAGAPPLNSPSEPKAGCPGHPSYAVMVGRGRRTTSTSWAPGPGPALARAHADLLASPSPEGWRRAGAAIDSWLSGGQAAELLPRLRGSAELSLLLPELAVTDGFDQRSPYHPEGDLYTHICGVVARICELSEDPDLRWAGLLHDIGKPDAFWADDEGVGHFYANKDLGKEDHEELSARMAGPILDRFGIPAQRAERIIQIVRHHMFGAIGNRRAARRFIERVGEEFVEPLLIHRQADWEGEGDPREMVAAMRAWIARAHEAAERPPAALSIGGGVLIRELGLAPGPEVGRLIGALAEEVAGGGVPDEPAALIARARMLIA